MASNLARGSQQIRRIAPNGHRGMHIVQKRRGLRQVHQITERDDRSLSTERTEVAR